MSINDMGWIDRGRRLWPPIKMTFLIVLWISLFIVGYHVDSEPIRLALSDSARLGNMDLDEFLTRLVKTLFTWTWPNCLMLCCLAAVIGDIGRQVSDNPQISEDSPAPLKNATKRPTVTEYRPALSRAFFVFILLLSGQLILGGSLGNPVAPSVPDTSTVVVSGALTDIDSERPGVTASESAMVATDAARYFRIASFVSFLGFMVGYNPAVFKDFLQRAL